MKTILPLILCSLCIGCSATRTVSSVGLGAGGAAIGHQLGDGKILPTVLGGAGGVLLSEGIHHVAKTQTEKAFAQGYDKGRSDAVKQQYWLYVDQHRAKFPETRVRLYEIQMPEQRIDGVLFKPTTRNLRIEE